MKENWIPFTVVFRKAAQSLVRPWALILGGRLYSAKISVEYYLYLFPYTVRPTLYRVWKLFRYLCPRSRLYCAPNMDYTYIYCAWILCICSCSETGNMQLPYNSPGGYLVHVLFSQWVYVPINGPGRPSENPGMSEIILRKSSCALSGVGSIFDSMYIALVESTYSSPCCVISTLFNSSSFWIRIKLCNKYVFSIAPSNSQFLNVVNFFLCLRNSFVHQLLAFRIPLSPE